MARRWLLEALRRSWMGPLAPLHPATHWVLRRCDAVQPSLARAVALAIGRSPQHVSNGMHQLPLRLLRDESIRPEGVTVCALRVFAAHGVIISGADGDALQRCLLAYAESVYSRTRVLVVGSGDQLAFAARSLDSVQLPTIAAAAVNERAAAVAGATAKLGEAITAKAQLEAAAAGAGPGAEASSRSRRGSSGAASAAAPSAAAAAPAVPSRRELAQAVMAVDTKRAALESSKTALAAAQGLQRQGLAVAGQAQRWQRQGLPRWGRRGAPTSPPTHIRAA